MKRARGAKGKLEVSLTDAEGPAGLKRWLGTSAGDAKGELQVPDVSPELG